MSWHTPGMAPVSDLIAARYLFPDYWRSMQRSTDFIVTDPAVRYSLKLRWWNAFRPR